MPPAGTYFQFTFYGYSGGSSADIPLNGRLNLDLEGNAALGLATGVWSLDSGPVLGGQPYLTALVPFGWKETKLGATLTGPGGDVLSGSRQEDSFLIGDPAIGGGIGWKSENLLTSLNLLVNVPIGDYQQSRTTNISFNHWAGDLTAAATWLGADGWQLDGAAGLSVNAENPDTDYRTGNELHLEAAVAKTTGAWTVGLAGYHYQQITGDSGDGAVLGDFKGRVSALGPAVSWAGAVGKRPVAVDARWLHEFDAKNRVEGDALLFNVTVPLGG
ncbi:SphA family protein [Paracoccus sp. KR1-242]|uniref:SphA family protein n=1 Tax=Paracoccus sp. KR1-242 TaxID=3410028 RepID=UPI003C0BEE71